MMFVYIKNTSADADLTTIAGSATVPIGWWWERIGEASGKSNYLSISLMLGWFMYLIGGVVEFIAWIMYMTENMAFARFYFRTVGYWVSVIFYAVPFIFAVIQVCVQTTLTFPGSWALF